MTEVTKTKEQRIQKTLKEIIKMKLQIKMKRDEQETEIKQLVIKQAHELKMKRMRLQMELLRSGQQDGGRLRYDNEVSEEDTMNQN